jgi:predicted transcriptional regulator
VEVKKKFRAVRIYKVAKRVNESTNAISRYIQSLVDKYVLSKEKNEQ